MSTSDFVKQMYENFFSKKDDLEQKVLLLNQQNLFGQVSLKITQGTPAEYYFIRTVSWFYALYYEAGRVNVKFLLEQQKANKDLDPESRFAKHYALVSKLRTFFQHNLVYSEEHDSSIKVHCEQWFKEQCGLIEPIEDQNWENCLLNLLKDACDFLESLIKCIQYIEQDESRDEILLKWDFQRKRYHPPHEFHKLIKIVATDMGRDHIDEVRLYNKYKDDWNKYLALINGDYIFEKQVRKLIEIALLENKILPIDGTDIMEYFGLQPGSQIGQLRSKAQDIYNADPYLSPEKILEKLRED
jgi:hypothetical protein